MERPYIFINLAISADGKIGISQKGPSQFTSKTDLARLLQIRLRADAILVGRGTLEADNMSLSIPSTLNPTQQPLRCLISKTGHFDTSHKIFKSKGGPIHLIATQSNHPSPHPPNSNFHCLSLPDFLQHAKKNLGVENLLCEGGGSLVKELFKLDIVDEINLTVAGHSLIGGQDAPTITGIPNDFFPDSRLFQLTDFEATEEEELFATWKRQRD